MYCPNCGSESQGFNYCKRCGGNLTAALQPIEPPAPVRISGFPFALALTGMSMATAIVTLAGLGIVLAYVEDMARQQSGDLPKMILVLGMMMVSAISGLLIWQIARLLSLPRQTASTIVQPQRPPRAAPLPLTPPPAGIASVTENTTRNFDPAIYRESKANE